MQRTKFFCIFLCFALFFSSSLILLPVEFQFVVFFFFIFSLTYFNCQSIWMLHNVNCETYNFCCFFFFSYFVQNEFRILNDVYAFVWEHLVFVLVQTVEKKKKKYRKNFWMCNDWKGMQREEEIDEEKKQIFIFELLKKRQRTKEREDRKKKNSRIHFFLLHFHLSTWNTLVEWINLL